MMNYSTNKIVRVIGIGFLAFAMKGQAQWTPITTGDYRLQNSNGNVFTLNIGAPASSIYVDSDGDTSLGTVAPINDFNSRLLIEDVGPDIAFKTVPGDQTWTLFANDNAFGLCDETTYPQVGGLPEEPCEPFRIQVAAPLDSFVIRDSGFIGSGTANPESSLHLVGDLGTKILVENTDANFAPTDQVMYELKNASTNKARFFITSGAGSTPRKWSFNVDYNADFFEISRVGTGVTEFLVQSNGDMSVRGVARATSFVNTSARSAKTDFAEVDYKSILEKVIALQIPMWRYKIEDHGTAHLGPIAEDFHAAFGLGDGETISTVDSSGVALAAVKGLHEGLQEKEEEVRALKARLSAQDERILQLEMAVSELLRGQETQNQLSSLD
jgi:hypothetical protein